PYPTGTPLGNNLIDAITSTGFVLGDDFEVNQTSVDYYWAAWPASPNVVVGSYAGNGTSQMIDIGVSPDWLWICADGQRPVQRFAVDPLTDHAAPFDNTAGGSGMVTSLEPTGFDVGTAPETNASGTTYYYIAFHVTPDFAAISGFIGTAAARTFSGMPF